MTIREFLDGYDKLASDNLKENFLNARITTEYIPFTVKMSVCEKIAYATTHIDTGEGTKYKKAILKENTNARYVLFTLNIIDLYTDIGIEWDNPDISITTQFEMLDKSGMIETIVSLVPEIEISKFENILQASVNDMLNYENSIINYLDVKFDSIGLVFEGLKDVLAESIQQAIGKNLDIEMVKELIDSLDKNKDNVDNMSDSDNIIDFKNKDQ